SRLPVSDVDPELVSLGASYIQLNERVGNYLIREQTIWSKRKQLYDYANSPGAIFESALRGYMGDPFGKYLEVKRYDRQLGEEFQDALQEMQTLATTGAKLRADAHRLRAVLGAKYGQDFPVIE